MVNREQQLLVINPADLEESREEIMKVMGKISSINSTRFKFNDWYQGFDLNIGKFLDDKADLRGK
jgi:hypothetical protein